MPAPSPSDLVAHNTRFLRQTGRLKVYAAAEATLVVGNGTEWFQLCQMGFAADGSFHVAWPYLGVTDGIVAEVEFPEAGNDKVQLSLTDNGKFTSQRVKYSHHQSGVAQFSLSGRARNDIRRYAFPLTGPIGHLFHLQLHEPRAFKPLVRLKPRRLYVGFLTSDGIPDEFLIRGGWHRKRDIIASIQGAGSVGPVNPHQHRRTGETGSMTFWSPPLDSPVSDHLVGLLGNPVPTPTGVTEPGLVLIGGFDQHEIVAGAPAPVIRRGLAAMYPTRSSDELKARLGTIDITSPLAG